MKLFVGLLFFSSVAIDPEAVSYDYLANSRDLVDFLPYSAQERLQVAQTIQNLFDIYINRESKIEKYGNEYDIDPLPRIQSIVDKASNMTNYEFNTELSRLFLSLRDFHTNYYMPGVHACLTAFKSLWFTVIDETLKFNGQEVGKVVVAGSSYVSEIRVRSPESAKVQIGDELLAVDGVGVYEYIQSLKYVSGGANEFGSLRASLMFMSVRNGKLWEMPPENTNVYTFKSILNGEVYNVNLPWVVMKGDACVENNLNLAQAIIQGDFSNRSYDWKTNENWRKFSKKPAMSHILLDSFKQAYPTGAAASKLAINQTDEPTVNWSIYEPDGKNMGIIFLESFHPVVSTVKQTIMIIRELLLTELKDTNSLLFDVRNNGGGYIDIADLIPQFFVRDFESMNHRAIVDPINRFIFNAESSVYDEGLLFVDELWKDAINTANPNDTYTKYVKFTTMEQINSLGMVYMKPVGVFTDGNCYSACDLFAGNMQDSFAAKIYGVDGSTGAGGANVVDWTTFLTYVANEYFPEPPYVNEFDSSGGSPNARLGWRDSIRVGKHKDQLIEDIGIISDKIIRPSRNDIQPNNRFSSRYDIIAQDLLDLSMQSGKEALYFYATPSLMFKVAFDDAVVFEIDFSGFSMLKFDNYLHETVLKVEIDDPYKRQQRQIRFPLRMTEFGVYRFYISGFKENGTQILETSRYVQTVVPEKDYLKIQDGASFKFDLTKLPPYAGQYIFSGESGWNPKDGTLVIGNGIEYTNNLDAELVYFISSDTPLRLSVLIEYETEAEFDYFYFGYEYNDSQIFFRDPKGGKDGPKGYSGKGQIDGYFDIPNIGNFQMFFKFVSDELVAGIGVKVLDITIESVAA